MIVTRARNYRLYTKSTRILDISLDAGRCLFGHNPKGLAKQYKNSISRALYVPEPSAIHGRVIRRIKEMFPQYKVLIFPDRRSAMDFVHESLSVCLVDVDFCAVHKTWEYQKNDTRGKIELWRPFLCEEAHKPKAEILLPIFPQPGYLAPQVLLYKENAGLAPRNIPQTSHILLFGLNHILILLKNVLQYKTLGSVAKMKHRPRKHRNSLGTSRAYFAHEQWSRCVAEKLECLTRQGPYMYIRPELLPVNIPWSELRSEFPQLKLPEAAEHVHILPSLASAPERRLLLKYFAHLDKCVYNSLHEKL